MPTYVYEAVDSQGKEVKAEIEAISEKDANDKIRAMNYYPTRVVPKGGGGLGPGAIPTSTTSSGGMSFAMGVSAKKLSQFTRQFATLLDAGLPMVRSLDILMNQHKKGLLKITIADIKSEVEGGSSLSDALSKHPRVFDRLYVNMVRAGEAGGVLDQILSRLAEYMEKSIRLKQKIIGALIYPIAVITIAVTILSLIMIFIIPKFKDMFKEMDIGQLPAITQFLLDTADIFVTYWYLLLIAPVVIYFIVYAVGKTPRGRYAIDQFKLKFPIFGIIISKTAISRFCRTLGTLVQSGVPILNALSIIKNATGNAVIAQAVEDVHNSIREGESISEPLKHSGVFDDLVVNMIQVGEETGELEKMLMKVADTYEDEVDTLVGALMSVLEPILIIVMGLIVGFIVIALFMPLITIMERLQQAR